MRRRRVGRMATAERASLMAHVLGVVPATARGAIYDYLCATEAPPGTRVSMELRRKIVRGVTVGPGTSGLPPEKLKTCTLLNEPPLSPGMTDFLLRAAEYLCTPPGDLLHMIDRSLGIDLKPPRRSAADKHPPPDPLHASVQLNDEQQAAVRAVIEHPPGYAAFLLDGITGSGKTEVYGEIIAALLQQKKQVLVLMPEVGLALQAADRFEKRFGVRPPCRFSDASPAELRRIRLGTAAGTLPLVIGARSALFLPFADLGAILVDEEHDGSYKQEEGLRYQARDMAVLRARCENIPVVLGTATPSLETHINALNGRYTRLTLRQRFGAAGLPAVHVVDMRGQARGNLSAPLRDALRRTKDAGRQSLLYINRRGYAPLAICRRCGARQACDQCDGAMSVCDYGRTVRCGRCGGMHPLPKRCEKCGGADTFTACGTGVERLEEEVRALFPDMRCAVISSDVVEHPKDLQELLDKVRSGGTDVLIGTQMIAKGHHFPLLTCVGVVDADLGLNGGDLRASENTYRLIEQVGGRAGREADAGEVYIQTHDPAHPVIRALAERDRDGFLAAETDIRRAGGYPPFGGLAAVIFSSEDEPLLQKVTLEAAAVLPSDPELTVFGPAPALFYRVRNRYRVRFLFKLPRRTGFAALFREWPSRFKLPAAVRMTLDIDPYTFY